MPSRTNVHFRCSWARQSAATQRTVVATLAPQAEAAISYESSPNFLAQRTALVDALVVAAATREYDGAELPAAVAQFATDARANGLPPERLLVALKHAVTDPRLTDLSNWWRGVLIDRVIRWGIEAYYGIARDTPPSPQRRPDTR
jgi:hypothetical protein